MRSGIDTGEVLAFEFSSLLPQERDKTVSVTRGAKSHLTKYVPASRCHVHAVQKFSETNIHVLWGYRKTQKEEIKQQGERYL